MAALEIRRSSIAAVIWCAITRFVATASASFQGL